MTLAALFRLSSKLEGDMMTRDTTTNVTAEPTEFRVPPKLETLTLKQLHAALAERGVEIGYTTLCEFLKNAEVEQLLNAGGTGNRREFLPEVVDILGSFFPAFRAAGGKMPHAPGMLLSFLKQPNSLIHMVSPKAETPLAADPVVIAEAQGRAQGLAQSERVLTAQEAADVLKISTRLLRRTVPAWKRFGCRTKGDRWLLSDLLADAGIGK